MVADMFGATPALVVNGIAVGVLGLAFLLFARATVGSKVAVKEG